MTKRTPGYNAPAKVSPVVLKALACIYISGILVSRVAFADVDLAGAVIVAAGSSSKAEKSAVAMLVEEIESRTRFRLGVVHEWPADPKPVIALGTSAMVRLWAGPNASLLAPGHSKLSAEGFSIHTVSDVGSRPPAVLISGNDERGVLFGAGRLLRELEMSPGRLRLPQPLNMITAPRFPIRGHQMGYRPKTNSYDGWDEGIWRQYIRDLVVFGTNAVELIPPRSDDAPDSPHFPLPPIEMLAKVTEILDDFGLDVWIWYPAMDPDYANPETVKAALAEWSAVFQKMKRLDAVFVPGGDPGHTAPAPLMAFLDKMTAELHRHHPKAGMWVSPQGFDREWLSDFLHIVKDQQPRWLSGLVYGPQTRIPLREFRAEVPAKYPIRHYPDITHSLRSQYPVPDWDLAYALTEGRETINPRPMDEAAIFRATSEGTAGFITYSEGCNDDVNKFVWSGLGWDPDLDVAEIIRHYSRYFIGPAFESDFSRGLFALERNWRGPLLKNNAVEGTLILFQKMEQQASPFLLRNWRFQQALYRAYYDAYIRERLRRETAAEQNAMDLLREAATAGSLAAVDKAEKAVWDTVVSKKALDLRTRIYQLAEALFQSIRMQLSVPLYRAIGVDRGANLDALDQPLNNRLWLSDQLGQIRKLGNEEERLRAIDAILNWTNPGQGGFYDDLGNPAARSHLVSGLPYDQDPAFFLSPQTGFACRPGWRLSWCRHADVLFDNGLKLRYSGLDPEARYRLRVVYAGELRNPVRLTAGETLEIHPLMPKPNPVRPVEFDLPPESIRGGELTLRWTSAPGRGGAGRGPQVAEVWLIKK